MTQRLDDKSIRVGKLNLIDLAGSENVKTSNAVPRAGAMHCVTPSLRWRCGVCSGRITSDQQVFVGFGKRHLRLDGGEGPMVCGVLCCVGVVVDVVICDIVNGSWLTHGRVVAHTCLTATAHLLSCFENLW